MSGGCVCSVNINVATASGQQREGSVDRGAILTPGRESGNDAELIFASPYDLITYDTLNSIHQISFRLSAKKNDSPTRSLLISPPTD